MARGRRGELDAVKAMKGNPGKRRLALEGDDPARDRAPAFAPPEFLTDEREREIFKRVVEEFLQRRIARGVDLTAFGRWASYVHRWVICKEQLDGKATWFKTESQWGSMLRRHPLFKDMIDLERLLQSLEDRLGLNPIARQNIIRGLAAVPPALGGLFGDDPYGRPEEGAAGGERPQPEGPALPSPIGVLRTDTVH